MKIFFFGEAERKETGELRQEPALCSRAASPGTWAIRSLGVTVRACSHAGRAGLGVVPLAWKGVRSDPLAAALCAPELKGASDARGRSKSLIPGVIQTRQDPGRGFLRVWGAVAETKGLAGEDGAVVSERPVW